MRSSFPGYYRPSEAEFDRIWNEGVVVPDANVLLDIFRYSDQTAKALLDTLHRLGERLWLSHQAAWEYHNNLPEVLADGAKSYDQATDDVERLLEKLQSHRGHPFVSEELLARVEALLGELKGALGESRKGMMQLLRADQRKDVLAALFDGKVASGFTPAELDEIYREGAKRYSDKVPPGYKDSKKEPNRNKYGDLITWKELLRHATDTDGPIMFITADMKEDWFLEKLGSILSPRPELLQEFYESRKGPFYIYSTEQFLELATDRLHAAVSVENLKEVQELQRQKQSDDAPWRVEFSPRVADYLATMDTSKRAVEEYLKSVSDVEAARKWLEAQRNLKSIWSSSFANYMNAQEVLGAWLATRDELRRSARPDAESVEDEPRASADEESQDDDMETGAGRDDDG